MLDRKRKSREVNNENTGSGSGSGTVNGNANLNANSNAIIPLIPIPRRNLNLDLNANPNTNCTDNAVHGSKEVFDDDRLALTLAPPRVDPPPSPSIPRPPSLSLTLTLGGTYANQPPLKKPCLAMRRPPPSPFHLPQDLFIPRSFLQLQPPGSTAEAVHNSSESTEPDEGSTSATSKPQKRLKPVVLPEGKQEAIPPPYPWSSDRRATVLPLETLLERGIRDISGQVHCKKCNYKMFAWYNLQEKFKEVMEVLAKAKDSVHKSAPEEWLLPRMNRCPTCDQMNSMRPVVAEKKRDINWLFMLLGQTLGLLTVEQLRYFCKHQRRYRTLSKSRLLYTTYVALCGQLDPRASLE